MELLAGREGGQEQLSAIFSAINLFAILTLSAPTSFLICPPPLALASLPFLNVSNGESASLRSLFERGYLGAGVKIASITTGHDLDLPL